MFKKRPKKALSHVDWAISLSIFLLYLAWFFLFVKPVLMPSESIGNLIDVLEDGLEDSIFDDVQRMFILVPASPSDSTDLEPVIADFSNEWAQSKISHSADYFELDEGKIFFLANLTDSTRYTIYYPHVSLASSERKRVIATSTKAEFGDFSAYFDSQLLDYVRFAGTTALQDFSIEVDDDDFSGDGVFANMTLAAGYKVYDDHINNSAYVFAENPRIYSFIRPTDSQNHSVVISMQFHNYTSYYFDPVSNGKFSYTIPKCKYYEADFLELYDLDSGVTITFGRTIDYKLCTNDTNIIVDLEFDMTGEESYNLYFHDVSFTEMLDYPLPVIEGVTETLEVISREKVQLLRNRDYDYLRQEFNYPGSKDFNITVSGDSFSASYGVEQPVTQDVYAKRLEGFAIDKDLEQERVSVMMTVW